MNVQIIEIKTGNVTATIPTTLSPQIYIPSEQDYFAEAWRCAVEDKIVEPARRGDYTFRLMRHG